jgi:hypothetical protein
MYFAEKICAKETWLRYKLEFNVNASPTYIKYNAFKQEHSWNKFIIQYSWWLSRIRQLWITRISSIYICMWVYAQYPTCRLSWDLSKEKSTKSFKMIHVKPGGVQSGEVCTCKYAHGVIITKKRSTILWGWPSSSSPDRAHLQGWVVAQCLVGFLCPNLKSFKMLILSLIPQERCKRPTSQGGPDHSLGSPHHSKILMVFLSSDNLNFWCFWFSDMEIYLWITLKTRLALSTRRWFTGNTPMENLWRSKPNHLKRNT